MWLPSHRPPRCVEFKKRMQPTLRVWRWLLLRQTEQETATQRVPAWSACCSVLQCVAVCCSVCCSVCCRAQDSVRDSRHVTCVYIWMSHVTYACVMHIWKSDFMHELVLSIYEWHMPSCCTWVSQITNDWVMSHMNESCIYERVISCMNKSFLYMHDTAIMLHVSKLSHVWVSHVTYEWVMHVWKSDFMHELVLCIYEWHMPSCCAWMSQVTYEWVMSQMNESCHICMSHAYMKESNIMHEQVLFIYEWHMPTCCT